MQTNKIDNVKEGEMGACSTNGRDEKCVQNFDLISWKEEPTRKT